MKLVFDMARNQVTIEGDGPDLVALLQAVRDVAPKLSEIRLVTGASGDPPPDTNGTSRGSGERPASRSGAPTMREFARAMGPSNMSEKIVAIGAYLKRHEAQQDFSPKEMGEYFTVCGFEKPSQMPVAIFDAKRKYGYLDKADRGRWKLSTSGENLVTRKLNENGGAP